MNKLERLLAAEITLSRNYSENRPSIRKNASRKTIKLENIIKECYAHEIAVKGCFRGIKWEYLDSLSTSTKMTENPLDRDKPSIKSIDRSIQMSCGMGNDCKRPIGK